MAPNVVRLNPIRIRSWINRLTLFTRIILCLALTLWILDFPLPWLSTSGALVPAEVGLTSMTTLNTYPLVHSGVIQLAFDLVALVPLLERFESEHGTLISIAMFIGPFSTFPGALYVLLDHYLLRSNHSIRGASIWVFLLLACESVKQYRSNPYFTLGSYKIPTWISTIIVVFVVNFLIPNTTLLGHLCGALIGYLFELGYLKILLPPEKALRYVEGKLNLLGRLPHYVSVDQKTYGRYGVLDSKNPPEASGSALNIVAGPSQRLE